MSEASAKRVIRVFISSPADVKSEREIVCRAITHLGREFRHHFDAEPVMWEPEPLPASASFQAGIVKPHATDIVIVILWSKLGSLLGVAEQPGPLSGRQVTGTEWEFEDALAGYRRTGERPALLLYRKTTEIRVALTTHAEVAERMRQKELVADFIRRWTLDADGQGSIGAVRSFANGVELRKLIEEHLKKLLEKHLRPGHAVGKVWHEAPYRGLESFEPEHEQIFFGRERARNELRELLAQQIDAGVAFVLVLGASGSGKSSLVKAGLVPDLAEFGMIGGAGLAHLSQLEHLLREKPFRIKGRTSKVSTTGRGPGLGGGSGRGRDLGRRLRRQLELELVEQDLLVGVWLGVTGEDEHTAVGGGEVNVEHFDVGELVEDSAWGEAAGESAQAGTQGGRAGSKR